MNFALLLLINGLTWLLVLAETLFPIGVLRFGLGIPFLLFFPGYSVLVSLRIGMTQRLALSVVLSTLVVTLIGFCLNYTPWGITLNSVTYGIAVFITLSLIFAAIRLRRSNKEDIKPIIDGDERSQRSIFLSIVAVVAILGTLSVSTYFIFAHKTGEAFTDFSVASTSERAINFPQDLKVGQNLDIYIFVSNHENKGCNYSVQVTIDGFTSNIGSGKTLANGETWNQPFQLSFKHLGQNERVEFVLLKDGQIYLAPLYIWFNIIS